jgi:hypothetical protein
MEFDPVPGEPGLPVEEVEEGDTDDTGPGADPRCSARRGHLLAPLGGRSRGAERGRRLSDHRARAAAQDEMVVEIALGPVERDSGDEAEDLALAQEPPSAREVERAAQARQVGV